MKRSELEAIAQMVVQIIGAHAVMTRSGPSFNFEKEVESAVAYAAIEMELEPEESK